MANLHVMGFFGLVMSFSAAVVLPLFAGCNSSISGGGTGGQNTAGGNVGGHGSSNNIVIGGAGGGTAVDCEALAANDVVPPVTVRFINHTNADIYVGSAPGSCGQDSPPYTLKDPQGNVLSTEGGGPCGGGCGIFTCTTTCTSTSTCPQHYVTRIGPQATLEIPWEGSIIEERTLPGSCYAGNCGASVNCLARVKPPAVPLSVMGAAWTAMQCDFGMCQCTPDDSGTCVAAYGTTGGTLVEGTGTLAPGGTSVDVIFQ